MAKLVVPNARILGCSLVTGETLQHIKDVPAYYNHDPALLNRLTKLIGCGQRFIAAPQTTTADLCEDAAARLLSALALAPSSLDAIISVTQTPDYPMPGNAHVLHSRLGLSKDAAALDVLCGCSGFVYGLWLAAMMVSSGMRRVLLVAGDTLSKMAHANDRTLAPLFGDAGSATVVEASPRAPEMRFILHADGSGLEKMFIPAGGSRTPSSEETRREITYPDGCVRSRENLYMDGFGIFEFTMLEQPGLLQDMFAFSGHTAESIDYVILHQANKYIVDTITQKAGIAPEKAPSGIFSRYGNQNSASIPGVLCGELAETLAGAKAQTILQGYGAGLSWGACHTVLDRITCLKPAHHAKETG